ncbi:hypothetical protein ACIGCP_19510 [Cellulophaga baltica]|uniref:hypothetical protein n=1 Tax=Cellulophaga baltica TaxID=76594 RepID=UPI0037C607D1
MKDQEILEKMSRLCANYRGTIIHEIILLETGVDSCVSEFFSGSNSTRREDMYRLLIHKQSGVSFSSKMLMFTYIVKNYFQDFNKKNNDLIQSLTSLIVIRNMAAHRKMKIPEKPSDFDGETINLHWVTTKKGLPKEEGVKMNPKLINDVIAERNRLYTILSELLELIQKENLEISKK